MTVFDDANDTLFESEMAIDAIYRRSSGSEVPVRVVESARDLDLDGPAAARVVEHVFDLRALEISAGAKGERLTILPPHKRAGAYQLSESGKIVDRERTLLRLYCVRV